VCKKSNNLLLDNQLSNRTAPNFLAKVLIIVSGFLDIPKFQEALERFHPVAVLQKPVGISALREAVEKGLGSRH